MGIFGAFLEFSYERILDEDISVGASLGVSVDGGDNYGYKYLFSSYFRWFFGGNSDSQRKYVAGLFLEVNASVFSSDENKDYGINETQFEIGSGLGFGFGWKYISKNNWVGEVLLGAGKNFSSSGGAYPRIGISIGKRF